MASKVVKKRNWAFLLYPESAPNNWKEQLQQTGLKCAISPLHDRDVYDDGDGEKKGQPKKPHHHVIICYEGPQTYNAVKTLTEHLRQPVPKPLESMRGNYRYFTHMDHPDKAQYSADDIITLNGFDIRDYVEMTRTEVNKIIRKIQEFIRYNHVYEYSDLLDILQDGGEGMDDWYDVAISHTLLLTSYLRSRRESRKG